MAKHPWQILDFPRLWKLHLVILHMERPLRTQGQRAGWLQSCSIPNLQTIHQAVLLQALMQCVNHPMNAQKGENPRSRGEYLRIALMGSLQGAMFGVRNIIFVPLSRSDKENSVWDDHLRVDEWKGAFLEDQE